MLCRYVQETQICSNDVPSSQLAAAEEMTSDEIISRLGSLEITQEDAGDRSEAAVEPSCSCTDLKEQQCDCCNEEVEGQVCHKITVSTDGNSKSVLKVGFNERVSDASDDDVANMQHVNTADDKDEDNGEKTEEGEMSTVTDYMSELTLETSAADVTGVRDKSTDDGTVDASSEHDDDDDDDDEKKKETDCISVMPSETSSVAHCVRSDEQWNDADAGRMALTSDCCGGNSVNDVGCQHNDDDDDDDDEKKKETDCISVMPSETSSVAHCVRSDEQWNDADADAGRMALTSDCCGGNSVNDVGCQHDDGDDDDKNDVDEAHATAANEDDIDSSSLAADGMFCIFILFC